MKKLFIIISLTLISTLYASDYNYKFQFIKGSHIYRRIFIFYFPLSRNYKTFSHIEDNKLDLDIMIRNNDIIKEPESDQIFNDDLTFSFNNIPIESSGVHPIPITIRVNQIILSINSKVSILKMKNIFVVKTKIESLKIKDLISKEHYNRKENLKLPLYFDLRLQIDKRKK